MYSIAVDENRFTVLQLKKMCHLIEYLCTTLLDIRLHVYIVFHDGLSCVVQMIIVRYI